MGLEVLERLRFLVSLPLAGTAQKGRGGIRVANKHFIPPLISLIRPAITFYLFGWCTEVEKWLVRGLVKFATAVARLVCPDLLG